MESITIDKNICSDNLKISKFNFTFHKIPHFNMKYPIPSHHIPSRILFKRKFLYETNLFGGQTVLGGKLFWGAYCIGAFCFRGLIVSGAFCFRGLLS